MKHLAIFLSLLTLAGCQTASGRAIGGRLGASMQGLVGSTRKLFGEEFDRSTHFPAAVRGYAPEFGSGLARLTRSTRGLAGAEFDRLTGAPRAAAAFGAELRDSATRDLGSLTNHNSRFARQNRPAVVVGRLRDEVRRIPEWIDLGAPLFGGPGDPDRSTDPDHAERRATFVERFLRRF